MVCFDESYTADPKATLTSSKETDPTRSPPKQQEQASAEAHQAGDGVNHGGDGVVLSLGSFTKILAPGLRVGWVEAAPGLLEPLASSGYVVSGGGVAPFASEVIAEAVAAGDQDVFLDHLRVEYARRAGMLHGIISEAGLGLEIEAGPTGGYFAWIKLPPGIHAAELLSSQGGVSFLP